MHNILILQNNSNHFNSLNLSKEFKIYKTDNIATALQKILKYKINLIIIDLLQDPIITAQYMKLFAQKLHVPIFVILSSSKAQDRVYMLEHGAYDCLSRPYQEIEFIARIHAQLRYSNSHTATKKYLKYQEFIINHEQHTIHFKQQELVLTTTEFMILELLISNHNKVFSKQKLAEYALKRSYTALDRSIDMHICNLRIKLKQYSDINFIKTTRGFGYSFKV
jgi:two-component system, OmpR family, response regulator CpxR